MYVCTYIYSYNFNPQTEELNDPIFQFDEKDPVLQYDQENDPVLQYALQLSARDASSPGGSHFSADYSNAVTDLEVSQQEPKVS